MKSELGNLPRLMGTNLRITSIAILFISAYLIVPKIADTTRTLSILSFNSLNTISSESSTAAKANSQELNKTFIPPNHGGPDSQRGSGTR
ncbi:MAG: hypothetical protein KME32_11555 [Mojavia pulchra JT2-VF2]|jgi:hypothetical protein|uniref:Uncharacterized protein n=1 Tax=Mojavia pulchra JT2-VF2 TaxID=287848 RepID=A0A951UH55_9NOST|nr:hypothetical protein [Mojavia pulchra JT2-VF2]